MQIFNEPFYPMDDECAVALGYFDGLHIGHSAVISAARNYAKNKGIKTVVWTFENSPKSVFTTVKRITENKYKEKLFENLGTDTLYSFPFTEKIKGLSCEDFVKKVIVDTLKAKKVFCGFNYSFGAGGKGNPESLKNICSAHGVDVEILPAVLFENIPVSSTRVRECISEGDMDKAHDLLGRYFSFSATVTDGNRIGRTIGFPTANTPIPEDMATPKNGVYLTRVHFNGQSLFGVTNVGLKPTVGSDKVSAETHIFGFSGNLYGNELRIEFLYFLREERKFGSIDELKKQIEKDCAHAIKAAERYE